MPPEQHQIRWVRWTVAMVFGLLLVSSGVEGLVTGESIGFDLETDGDDGQDTSSTETSPEPSVSDATPTLAGSDPDGVETTDFEFVELEDTLLQLAMDDDDRELAARFPASFSLRNELMRAYLHGDLDVASLRSVVTDHRWGVNIELAQHQYDRRLPWLQALQRVFQILLLGALLFLAGPILLWWRHPADAATRRGLALWSAPYYLFTTAAVLIVVGFIIDQLIDLQGVQLFLASFGSPVVASSDGAMQYLTLCSDADLIALVDLLTTARTEAAHDPFAAMALVQHLWLGLDAAKASPVLLEAQQVFEASSWIVDLYGPLLALFVFALVAKIVTPVVRNLLRYPRQAIVATEPTTLGRFTKNQIGTLWREFRIMMWMMAFLGVVIVMAVVAIRLLAYPAAVASLKSLLTAERLLAAGGVLPDNAILASGISLALFLLTVSLLSLFAAGIVLSKALAVLRDRSASRRRFRAYPEFWRVVRGLFGVGLFRPILAGVICFTSYLVAVALIEEPIARIWLPTFVFFPLLIVLSLILGIPWRTWRLLRANPCPAAASDETCDER